MLFNVEPGLQKQIERYEPLVLIVDDDLDNLLFASYAVKSMGMRYAVIDNSEECLESIARLLPDIILLDIVMPKVSGLDIATSIRQDRDISHIPILAVTGLTKPQDIDLIEKAGCDGYVCKPYLIEELELQISRYLKCHSV